MRAPRRRGKLPPHRPRGPNGERYCRRCGEVLRGRRTQWCSDRCSLFARIEAGWQGAAREYLRQRDRGVCAACGLDTEALLRWLGRLWPGRRRWLFHRLPVYGQPEIQATRLGAAVRELERRGFDAGKSLWQADHIVPIVEGGELSPTNLQTLCVPCHKADTAALAARRARRRRPGHQLPIPGLIEGSA